MLVGVLELIGAGARQAVLDGRAAKPEITLLLLVATLDEKEDEVVKESDEREDEKLAALVEDCTPTTEEATLLLPPPPPPPQAIKHRQAVISSAFFTGIFMAITFQTLTHDERPVIQYRPLIHTRLWPIPHNSCCAIKSRVDKSGVNKLGVNRSLGNKNPAQRTGGVN